MTISLQERISANPHKNQISGELLEKVVLGNDLSGLTPMQKVEYVKGLCESLNLNLATKPIQLMKFQGKEVPYFTKDASEQLRYNNRVTISKIDTKLHDGGLYVVTAYATLPNGRQDCSTGAISISGLKGDALGNAMMKCETKAKRRVTLSICGLGFIDEMEVDSLPNAQKIDVMKYDQPAVPLKVIETNADFSFELSVVLHGIETCTDLKELKKIFDDAKAKFARSAPDILEQIIEAKDLKKDQLCASEFLDDIIIDPNTGEIVG